MKPNFMVLATVLLSSLSFSAMAEKQPEEKLLEAKPVIIVVENNDDLREKGIDPFVANAILGVKDIQDATKKAGILDCNCVIKDGNTYVSFTMGNGKASEGGSLAWRAFSLRIGKEITDDISIVFGHLNEGHPYNHHRDGFSLSAAYIKPIGNKFKVEASVGPYFSMDTTEVNGVELDDKKLGVVGTVALIYSLDNLVPGLQARLEYNHVKMPGAFSTNSVMLGVGKEFGPNSKKGSGSSSRSGETEVAVIGDIFITNHGDVDTAPKGFQVEAKRKLSKHTAGSLGYMKEGVDSRVDRQGVAAELWYEEPLTKTVYASVGTGVYLADNKLDKTDGKVNGLVSIEFGKNIGKHAKVFIRVNRIADFKGSNDRDVIGFGVAGKFK